jgi:hypothetical protein
LEVSGQPGEAHSQAGIVVLSEAFFAKRWTAYELDGLVQLYAGTPGQVAGTGQGSRIIPVWHGVNAEAVTQYSPSLANLVALNSRDGVEAVADRIFGALRPTGSTLLFAHAELTELGEPHGWHPPVITDDWWLDAAEASASNDIEGTFQEPMGWGHWGFPLPERGDRPRERGHRLARAAAQMMWQKAAEARRLSQCTPPGEVLEFIGTHPGLGDACIESPSYLLSYAPQLALPRVAEWLQDTIDATYEWGRERIRKQGLSPDSPEGRRRLVGDTGYLALRDIEMVRAAPSSAVGAWMSGDIHGPQIRVYDTVDYAGWLASEASEWMGHEMRAELLAGIAARGGWTDWDDSHERPLVTEQLLKSLNDRHDDPGLLKVVLPILTRRLGDTAKTLRLPETGDELAARLLAAGFVEKYKARGGRTKSG